MRVITSPSLASCASAARTVVRLTPREFTLLRTLMDNASRVLSREQLMQLAWGNNFLGVEKSVDVCIQRLRRKLQPHMRGPSYIQSLRGFGYRFSTDVPPETRTGEL